MAICSNKTNKLLHNTNHLSVFAKWGMVPPSGQGVIARVCSSSNKFNFLYIYIYIFPGENIAF